MWNLFMKQFHKTNGKEMIVSTQLIIYTAFTLLYNCKQIILDIYIKKNLK